MTESKLQVCTGYIELAIGIALLLLGILFASIIDYCPRDVIDCGPWALWIATIAIPCGAAIIIASLFLLMKKNWKSQYLIGFALTWPPVYLLFKWSQIN
jgi:hypothetical protein